MILCCYCHCPIHEAPMMVRKDGRYQPAHRDCGRHGGTDGRHHRQTQKKCRINKALRKYQKNHGGDNDGKN